MLHKCCCNSLLIELSVWPRGKRALRSMSLLTPDSAASTFSSDFAFYPFTVINHIFEYNYLLNPASLPSESSNLDVDLGTFNTDTQAGSGKERRDTNQTCWNQRIMQYEVEILFGSLQEPKWCYKKSLECFWSPNWKSWPKFTHKDKSISENLVWQKKQIQGQIILDE